MALDLGAGERGLGNLTAYVNSGLLPYVTYDVSLLADDSSELTYKVIGVPGQAGFTQIVVPYSGSIPYRYVLFTATTTSTTLRIDAVRATTVVP